MSRLGLQAALAGIGLVAALGCGNHDDSVPGGAAGQIEAGSAGREARGAGGEAGAVSDHAAGRDSTSQVGRGGSEEDGAGARAEGGALPGHDGAAGDGIPATGGGSSGGSEQAGDSGYGGYAGDAGDRGGNHSGGNGTTGGSPSGGTSHSGGGNVTGGTAGSPSGGSGGVSTGGTGGSPSGGSGGVSTGGTGGSPSGGSGGVSSGGSGGSTSGGSAGTGATAGAGPSVTVMKLDTLASSGWGAWQDGDGPWQQFSTAEAEYTFTPTGSRYGVATVGCWGMARSVNVQYRTTAITSLNACDRVPQRPSGGIAPCECGLPIMTGTLTNVGTSSWLDVEGFCSCSGFGGREITPVGGSTTYSADVLLPSDFLFAIADAQGEPFTDIAVKRAVVADTSTLDVDFNSDAKPATTNAFVITGLGGSDTHSHSIVWHTSGSRPLRFEAATDPDSADDTYSALDPRLVLAGDLYTFNAKALQGGVSDVATELWGEFATPADISFPVSYVSATASVAASAPYGRVQVDLLAFPGAQHYAMEATGQVVSGSPTVRWWVDATPDWFTGAAPYRLAMPNLDSASGWDNSRGFTPGSQATIAAYASIQSSLRDGSQTIVGKRRGLSAIP